MNELNQKIVRGTAWQFLERFVTVGLQLVVTIIMARMIAPKIYGLIALMQVFIDCCNPFIDGGFGMALIQRKKIDDLDCSTVFWFNLGMSVLFCVGIWVAAPLIAQFYHEPLLIEPLRIFEIMLIISSLTIVHMAILNRNMEFKKSFAITLGGILAYSLVGITWAAFSPSVWALVAATLMSALVRLTVLMCTIHWIPKFVYSWSRLWRLFSYSSKLLGNTLLSVISQNYTSLLIGRNFSSTDIAFYTRGKAYPAMLTVALDGTLSKVLFPVFSKQQDKQDELLHYCRLSIAYSFSLVFPALLLFAIIATPVVRLVLTEKWLPCVPFIRITCGTCLLWVISGIIQQCLNGRGNSGVVLMYRVFSMALSIAIVVYCSKFGIVNMLLIGMINSYLMLYVFIRILGRYVGIKFLMLIKDTWKIFIAGVMAGLVAIALLKCAMRVGNDLITIIGASIGFVAVYIVVLIMSNAEQVAFAKKLYCSIRKKKGEW